MIKMKLLPVISTYHPETGKEKTQTYQVELVKLIGDQILITTLKWKNVEARGENEQSDVGS